MEGHGALFYRVLYNRVPRGRCPVARQAAARAEGVCWAATPLSAGSKEQRLPVPHYIAPCMTGMYVTRPGPDFLHFA